MDKIFTIRTSHFSSAVPLAAEESERPINAVMSSKKPSVPINNRRIRTPFVFVNFCNSLRLYMITVRKIIVIKRIPTPAVNADVYPIIF